MAARPKKTSERGVKLPKSLVPTRRKDVEEFNLPYERLAIHLGFEVTEFGGCQMDHVCALYTVFAAICAQAGLPPVGVFIDLVEMGGRGELKAYMESHQTRCPHHPK